MVPAVLVRLRICGEGRTDEPCDCERTDQQSGLHHGSSPRGWMMRTATFNGREISCTVRIGAIQAACSLPREELARSEVRNGCERRGFSLYEVSHEQRETHRRSAAADGLENDQANRRAVEGAGREGTTGRS